MSDVKKLDRKDVEKAWLRWSFLTMTNYNYEKMQASGVTASLRPVLEKLYGDDKEQMKEAMQRHMTFFNTEQHFGGVILGMTCAMEEQKAQGAPVTGEMINGVKTGLMGPLAGLGDTLWQGTIVPICMAIGISMGIKGNLVGPFLYWFMVVAIMLSISRFIWMKGYDLGTAGVQKILGSNLVKTVIMGASILGAIVLGALTAGSVTVSIPYVLHIGDLQMAIQADVFDAILKGILPLAVTFLSYYLLKVKKMKSTIVILVLFIVSFVLGFLGILG